MFNQIGDSYSSSPLSTCRNVFFTCHLVLFFFLPKWLCLLPNPFILVFTSSAHLPPTPPLVSVFLCLLHLLLFLLPLFKMTQVTQRKQQLFLSPSYLSSFLSSQVPLQSTGFYLTLAECWSKGSHMMTRVITCLRHIAGLFYFFSSIKQDVGVWLGVFSCAKMSKWQVLNPLVFMSSRSPSVMQTLSSRWRLTALFIR